MAANEPEILSPSQLKLCSWMVASNNTGNFAEINSLSRRKDNNAKPFGEPGSEAYIHACTNKIPALVKSFKAHKKGGSRARWRFDYKLPDGYDPTSWLFDNSSYLRPLSEEEHQVQSILPSPAAVKFQERSTTKSTMSRRSPLLKNMKSMKDTLKQPADEEPESVVKVDGCGNPWMFGTLKDIRNGKVSKDDAQVFYDCAKQLMIGCNFAFFGIWLLFLRDIRDETNTKNLNVYGLTLWDVPLDSQQLYGLGHIENSNVFLLQVPSSHPRTKQYLLDTVAEITARTTGHHERVRGEQYKKTLSKLLANPTVVSCIFVHMI